MEIKSNKPVNLMNCIVIIGDSQTGKTTFAKKFLDFFPENKVHLIDFKMQFPENLKRYSDISEMIDVAKKVKNSLFIFDDATGLITRNASQIHNDLLFLLNTRRHDNNYYIFIFHSIAAFPVILECAVDFWVYFKTSDNPKKIMDRCSSLTEEEAKILGSKKNPFEYKIVWKK